MRVLLETLRDILEDKDDKLDQQYKEWKKLINMSPSELQTFLSSTSGKEAGMSRKEAGELGISSGRDSARAIIRMLKKKRENWNDNDYNWMKKQISFIKRMLGSKGSLKDEKGKPTRKLLALKIWGHNPLKESSVDFPKESLCPIVWKEDEGKWKLREKVKEELLGILMTYTALDLEDIATEINITGSIGTNLYEPDSDIDLHLIPITSKLPKTKTPEEWQKDIKKFFKEHEQFIGEHPIEVYLQLNPDQELMSDAVYEINSDVWVKGPYIVDLDYNPYSVFHDVLVKVEDLAKEADVELGELKRDVIDYDVIKKATESLPEEYRRKLLDDLKKKLKEIEEDIEVLMSTKKSWVDMRREASKPPTPEQALKDVKLVRQWKDSNAVFKLINRYGYIKLITELEKMMGDEKIDDEEIERLKQLMKNPSFGGSVK